MAKKKYTTVAEVAQAIGLNYYALSLLEYLEQYHPDLALDYDFIVQRADIAAQHAADYVKEHGSTDALTQREANNSAYEILTSGLEFSEHSIIFHIVDNYYYEKGDTHKSEEVRSIAIELRPRLKSIFAKYPTDDPEFTASCEYDRMVEKLTKKIERLLQKRDELPF
ncbi:MAG: DUF1896 domain-containing protein [Prevotellaceae bacterium]|jgi:hypothetical protein|nr:DUF1896 domain-containing protein [Prevotellaceae bacterium]